MTALHLGALHPVEQLLVIALAFGPFVVLGVVVYVVRRRDVAEEGRSPVSEPPGGPTPPGAHQGS